MDKSSEPDTEVLSEPHELLKTSCKSENTENISDLIGSWTYFQKRLFFLLSFAYFVSPFTNLGLLFYMIKSDFWCAKWAEDSEVSTSANTCNQEGIGKCFYWVHNTTRTTLIREWDLICERSWLISLALSAYQIGYLFSGPLIGYISDHHGRKTALVTSFITDIVCGTGLVISPSIAWFITFRFLNGIGGYGRYLSCLILLVESVGPSLRGKIVVAFEWLWHSGIYFMIFVTYFIDNFRHFYTIIVIYQIIVLTLVIHPLVPESPRWQLVKGFKSEASLNLKVAQCFKSTQEEQQFDERLSTLAEFLATNVNKARSSSICTIWRIPQLLKQCLNLYLIWAIITFSVYGLDISALDLPGSYFFNFGFIRFSAVLATIFLSLNIEKHSRKTFFITCFVATAISFLSVLPIADTHGQMDLLRTLILMIGGFFVASNFSMIYVYSAELFPTTFRQLAVGSCSTAGRLGSISAPLTNEITRFTSIHVTLGLFAVISVLGVFAVSMLPETKDKDIPDTIDQMLQMSTQVNKAKKSDPEETFG